MDKKNQEIAAKIFKAIKTGISTARKYNKEHNYTLGNWNRSRQQVDIEVWDNTMWDKQGNKYIDSYTIKVDGVDFAKVKTHYDVSEVFAELRNLLSAQKKVKGWGGLNYQSESVELASCSWSGYRVSIIPKVCFADAPCSEYKSLANYINKYGVVEGTWGSQMNLGNYELFSAAMGGKRGVLWDEYGERLFLDNKPKRCARILEELRKARGSKDKMLCKRGEEKYIDETDRKYSEYHEVECDGELRKYLKITIKTPQGKVKYETKIF